MCAANGTREGSRAADVPDGRVDHTRFEAGLHRAGDVPVDRERVTVAAADDDRADDRVGRRVQRRLGPVDPLQPSG
jgi:hypothetical protein